MNAFLFLFLGDLSVFWSADTPRHGTDISCRLAECDDGRTTGYFNSTPNTADGPSATAPWRASAVHNDADSTTCRATTSTSSQTPECYACSTCTSCSTMWVLKSFKLYFHEKLWTCIDTILWACLLSSYCSVQLLLVCVLTFPHCGEIFGSWRCMAPNFHVRRFLLCPSSVSVVRLFSNNQSCQIIMLNHVGAD